MIATLIALVVLVVASVRAERTMHSRERSVWDELHGPFAQRGRRGFLLTSPRRLQERIRDPLVRRYLRAARALGFCFLLSLIWMAVDRTPPLW